MMEQKMMSDYYLIHIKCELIEMFIANFSFSRLIDIKGKSLKIIVRSKNTSSIVGWSEKVFDNFYKR